MPQSLNYLIPLRLAGPPDQGVVTKQFFFLLLKSTINSSSSFRSSLAFIRSVAGTGHEILLICITKHRKRNGKRTANKNEFGH